MLFTCKDCDYAEEFKARTMRGAFELARTKGWSIGADNVTHYCPKCAPYRRHVGRGNKKRNIQIRLDI